jgi:hypothetical protein
VLAAVGVLDSWLLYRFFYVQLPSVKRAEALSQIRGAPVDS